jgi:hypothetical protein
MDIKDRLKSLLAKPSADSKMSAQQALNIEESTQKTRKIVIEKKQYIFGMEWRLLPPTRKLARSLKLAKQEGMVEYVLSEMEDLIGLSKEISHARGVKYSAALHLASKMSQGGVELYVFALQKGIFAVVALNESRPIPGFDFLGSQQAAREMVEEFKAIQAGHQMRMVGNTGMFEGEETVEPEDVFGEPAKSSRIKTIPDQSGTKFMIGLAIILALVFAGAMYWLNEQRKDVLDEVRAVDVDQSKEYKTSLQNSLRALAPAGPKMLQDWLRAIEKLPLTNAGWRLAKVECDPSACTAYWDREYGSYKDFNAHLPMYTQTVKEVQKGTDPLSVNILTRHNINDQEIKTEAVPSLLQFKDLPAQQLGVRELSSQLQELSLLGPIKVTMSQPKLFGATGEVSNAKEVMASGEWSIEHEIWSLPEIGIASNMITKSLVLTMPLANEKTVATYRLEGTYYVQEQKTP